MSDLFKQSAVPIVLFVIGAVLIFLWFKNRRVEGFADSAGPAAKGESYFFDMYYAEWCPHCTKALPIFQSFGPKQTIGGKTFVLTAYELDELREKGGEEWKNCRGNNEANPVKGYPTFRLYNSSGAMISEYDGPRTKEGMLEFLTKA